MKNLWWSGRREEFLLWKIFFVICSAHGTRAGRDRKIFTRDGTGGKIVLWPRDGTGRDQKFFRRDGTGGKNFSVARDGMGRDGKSRPVGISNLNVYYQVGRTICGFLHQKVGPDGYITNPHVILHIVAYV